MSLMKDLDTLDIVGKKGDWCFLRMDTVMILRWGDDVDDIVVLHLSEDSHPRWVWNGDKDHPTLYPSIYVHGIRGRSEPGHEHKWHGYLEDGSLRDVL